MGVLQDKDVILWMAQEKVSELAHEALDRENKGIACQNIYNRAFQILCYIRALQIDHGNLLVPEQERILSCIVEAAGLKQFPVAASIFPPHGKPSILTGSPGAQGPQGTSGQSGTDANVGVQSIIDNILVRESIVAGVRTFTLVDNTYVAVATSCAIDDSSLGGKDPDQTLVVEKGNLINPVVNESITKGRDNVLSYTATPADPGFDLPTINSSGGQTLALSEVGIDSTRTYTVSADDGTSSPSHSSTLTFVYPFFYGSGDTQSFDYYSLLTKLIQTKGNKTVIFNGTSKFFAFGYPASYGNLSQILDQNGFDVTGAFDKLTVTLSSSGLDVNWSVSYYFYVTHVATNIANHPYIFKF